MSVEGKDERTRNVITVEDLDDRERAGDRQMPGAQTFATPPPDEYEGRVVCWEVVRLGDHAHAMVCTGRQHAAGDGRPTFHRGEAGRLVMQWGDWLHLRGALDAGPEWLWVAEVEHPTKAQLGRYAGPNAALVEAEAREQELERERDYSKEGQLSWKNTAERAERLRSDSELRCEGLRAREAVLVEHRAFAASVQVERPDDNRGLLALGELEANLESFAAIKDRTAGEWIARELKEVRAALTAARLPERPDGRTHFLIPGAEDAGHESATACGVLPLAEPSSDPATVDCLDCLRLLAAAARLPERPDEGTDCECNDCREHPAMVSAAKAADALHPQSRTVDPMFKAGWLAARPVSPEERA